jgi:hypothetical protein
MCHPLLYRAVPQKNAWKKNEIPQGLLTSSKPLDGFAHVRSTPKDPASLFKPFHLSSLDKHEQYQQMRAVRLAAEERKVEQARHFKAQDLDKVGMRSHPCIPTPHCV